MNPLRGLRRLTRMVFRRSAYRLWGLSRSVVPWYRNVSDVTDSSTVAATVMWCARNFPEAPPALWQKRDAAQLDRTLDHPMLRLLERPNPYWSGVLFWMATVTDYKTAGEAFWWKRRNQIGVVEELWWMPSWTVCPKGSDSEYLTHYEYAIDGGRPFWIDPRDVVHHRFGVDPEDERRGMSPLKAVLREVFTDDEAAKFTATILNNMGVPGILVSPELSSGQELDDDEAAETKATIKEMFTGDRRGEPMVMTGPTKVQQFGFSPEQLLLRELRRIPEERVTAALGVPAIVVGLGAGLDRSTFTNMGEASEYAYSNGLIPDQRIMADTVRWQLLSEFEADPFSWVFGFDLSQVRALQADFFRLAQRHDLLVRGGSEMVSELRRAVGLPVDAQRDNIFLRQANLTMVPADGGSPQPLAPSRNGTGATAGLTAGEIADEIEARWDRRELLGGAR